MFCAKSGILKKREVNKMLESFLAFNQNALSNFAYMMKSNLWLSLMLVGVIGTIVLLMKEEVDTAVHEEQNIV